MMMGVGGRAELYSRIFGDITVKHSGYIVIEHVRIGTRMHANHGLFKLVTPIFISCSIKVKFGTGSE